jgi:hypothetical protein
MIECLGEYFINEAQREAKKKQEKKLLSKQRSLQKKSDKEQQFIPPSEDNDDGDDVHDNKHGEIKYYNSDDDENYASRNVAMKGKKNAKRGSMDEDQETKKRSKKQRK